MKQSSKENFINIAKQFAKEASPFVLVSQLYKNLFKRRERDPYLSFNMEDFPELNRVGYKFKSNKGQLLQGYVYSYKDKNPTTLIVFVHGFGDGGHHCYLDVINYLAKNGYYVFSYDATGNDESEGESINGFPQGIIDLNYAIDFIKEENGFIGLPIVLFGHSWGAYSVSNVLNLRDDVKAVIALSGFNESVELIKMHGRNFVGDEIDKNAAYLDKYEEMVFGEYANLKAVDAFKKTSAKIFIAHSEDDTTVPIMTGYDVYHRELKDNRNIIFRRYKNKGHGTIYNSVNGRKYIKDFYDKYNQIRKTVSEEERIKFIKDNIDKNIWCNSLDLDLFEEIFSFIDSAIM